MEQRNERKPIRVRPIIVEQPLGRLDALLAGKKETLDGLGMPDSGNYYAIPASKPHLRSFVRSFSWNCVKSEIEMLIEETPAFTTYDWIVNINVRRQKAKTEEFGDLQQESLVLVMMDCKDQEIGRIRFRGLELTSHFCNLDSSEEEETEETPVRHFIQLKYDGAERTAAEPKLNYDEVLETQLADPDADWSKTELEIQVDESSDQ